MAKPKTYKGIVRIECTAESCGLGVTGGNVIPECMNCEKSRVDVLDLEDKVMFTAGNMGEPEQPALDVFIDPLENQDLDPDPIE